MSQHLLQQFDETVRRHGRYVGRKVEILPLVTRVIGPSPDQLDNLVVWSKLDRATADEQIDAQISYFNSLGHNFEWITYSHDDPPDLADRLLAKGFEFESEEHVVIANTLDIGEQPLPEGILLHKIDDPGQLADVLALKDEVWGDEHSDFIYRWLTDLVVHYSEESSVLVAYDGKKPIACAWATFWRDRPFAPLFGGTVLPKYRGQGVYRAMVARRASSAADRGIQWCVVDAGSASLPILERLGFKSFSRRVCFRWKASLAE